MTLQELTASESGLVVFNDKDLIICNWSSFDGIPRVLMGQLHCLEDEIPACLMDETWNETEIISYLQDKNLIYSDLEDEINIHSARVFHLNGAITVLVPEGW